MARAVSPKNLEKYRQQQIELAKKIKEAEAEARKAAKEELQRKREIAGAIALKEFESNPDGQFASLLLGLLAEGLTKPADRALFNLPPLTKEPQASPSPPPVNGTAPNPQPSPAASNPFPFLSRLAQPVADDSDGTQHGG
jgi:hypothetical protein